MRRLIHLTASRFFGGPERQMLGLARRLRADHHTAIASFSETGLCRDFLARVAAAGLRAIELQHDTPHLVRATNEVRQLIRNQRADAIFCHGYKAVLIGLLAARREGAAAIGVSRGYTAESRRVRLYEMVDRRAIRWMDRVVCVSEAQAETMRRAGVAPGKITVIPNSVDASRFGESSPGRRAELAARFPRPPRWIVGAAGRLSPEKGFDVLIEAADQVLRREPDAGFLVYGEGALRNELERRIAEHGLSDRFLLVGFCDQLDSVMPNLDLFVQSSHSEGMPNVLLESLAAGVPIVATNVGGTAELVGDERHGRLVAAGDAPALAEAILRAIHSADGQAPGKQLRRDWVASRFTFDAQAAAYRRLLDGFAPGEPLLAGKASPAA